LLFLIGFFASVISDIFQFPRVYLAGCSWGFVVSEAGHVMKFNILWIFVGGNSGDKKGRGFLF